MKIITRVSDGETTVDVVDASDGTVVRTEHVADGEQVAIVAVNAHSPADLEVYGPEAIPEPEAESAEGNQPEGEDGAEASGEAPTPTPGEAQGSGEAEGAEAPADGEQPDGQAAA